MPNRSVIEKTIAETLKLMLPDKFEENIRSLPGTPDLVVKAARLAIFVNGCFWHSHSCMRGKKAIRRNGIEWIGKLGQIVARDHWARISLESEGWRVLVLWECDIRADLISELLRVQAALNARRNS